MRGLKQNEKPLQSVGVGLVHIKRLNLARIDDFQNVSLNCFA